MDEITKQKINKLLDECAQLSKRQTDLLNACFGYLRELISNDEELKRVLTRSIGMTDEEILEYGFELDEQDYDYDTKFTGVKFTFYIKDLSLDYPELAKFDRKQGTINSLEVGDGKTIENSYWNVIMDDGTELNGISGYHLAN